MRLPPSKPSDAVTFMPFPQLGLSYAASPSPTEVQRCKSLQVLVSAGGPGLTTSATDTDKTYAAALTASIPTMGI